MKNDFFQKPFLREGIQIVCPSEEEIGYLADKIAGELELGVVKRETCDGILNIVRRMKQEDQIDAIALGCTELPLVFREITAPPVPVLDTMKIHVDTLIQIILEEK